MLITLFEAQGFSKWCKESLEEHKFSIVDRAYELLLSTTEQRKHLKIYETMRETVFNHLDLIKFYFEEVDGNDKVVNTCLTDKLITIIYEEPEFRSTLKESELRFENLKFFLTNLSSYITDSVIIQWKMLNNLTLKVIKVENQRSGNNGFFPISYNTYSFIKAIQILCSKKVKFTHEYISTPSITKDSVICYFSPDRLESEYLIQQQLFDVYLYFMGFPCDNKFHFNDKRNWAFTEEKLEKALNILLQNQFSILFLNKNYPIFENMILYDLLNFRSRDGNIAVISDFLCHYCKEVGVCNCCNGIEDIFGSEDNCVLYKDNGVITKRYTLNELDTVESQKEIVNKVKENFSNSKK